MYKNLLFFFVLLSSSMVDALQLTPSSYELAPSGSLSQHVFEIINDSNEIIAVQNTVLTRDWLAEQKENNEPAPDFQVFPAQMILKPGEKKGLKVRWTGEKKLKQEKAFRLIVNQLPVNFNKNQKESVMKTLHQVVGALYVTPPGAKSKIALGKPENRQLVVDDKTKKTADFLVFDVTNTGEKHTLLGKAGLSAKGNAVVALTPDHFKNLPTQNVLAGSTLQVKLPWPKGLGDSVTEIVLP